MIDIFATRSGFYSSQQPLELNSFIQILEDYNVASYLEIGARQGDTFYKIMKSLPIRSRGLAVDFPSGAWGKKGSEDHLKSCIEDLSVDYDVDCVFGDSKEISIEESFDAVLIDADHRYEAVKKDWEIYKDKTKIIAFHDIAADRRSKVEVPRLWNEIKNDYEHIELINPSDKRPMGIGVLFT